MSEPRLQFDRRPLAALLLERSWRWAAFAALGWVLWMSAGDPWAGGLDPKAQRALGIFAVCLVLWVSNLLPLVITSILALVLPALLGVMPSADAFAYFGNNSVFFLLGAFVLAAAVSRSGLAERVTLAALDFSGGSPRRLSLGIYFTAAALSHVMSEHAVAAMLFPIVLEICRVLELGRRSRLGALLFLSLAWGCIIGGVATLLGGARNPLAIGILEKTTGATIGFFEWPAGIWPCVLAMLLAGYLVLGYFFPAGKESVAPAAEFVRKRRRKLGRVSFRERAVGLLLLVTVGAWAAFGHEVGLAEISLLSVVVLFLFKLITWREVEESVNWGVLLMYGGAIALGSALSKSGAAAWVAHEVLARQSVSPFFLIAALSFLSILLTEFISNAAVVSILMPVGLALAESLHLDAKTITFAIAMPSGLAFTLPMGTPAMALAYSSGYLRLKDVVLAGGVLALIALGVFLLVVRYYWPLIGLGVG